VSYKKLTRERKTEQEIHTIDHPLVNGRQKKELVREGDLGEEARGSAKKKEKKNQMSQKGSKENANANPRKAKITTSCHTIFPHRQFMS